MKGQIGDKIRYNLEEAVAWTDRFFGCDVYLLVEGNDQHGLAEEISL